jgi:hypothetical protein
VGPMIMAKEEGGDWMILNRCGKRTLVRIIRSNDGMVVVMGKGSRAESEVEQLEVSRKRSRFVIIVDLLLLPSSTPWIIQSVTQKYFRSSKVLDLGRLINQLQ